MTVTYHVGDSRAIMAGIPDGSVDLIASSPPFLALRSYLPAGHEAKGDEIGSEANPAAFLDTLLGLTAEWGRVLAPHGSLAIELGDTYSGSTTKGGPAMNGNGSHHETRGDWFDNRANPDGWPLAKSLALIPQLYAVALAYGINPLTGQPSPAGRWRVRNVIVWHRPNPAVGALGDKVRPSTSYIVVATRSAKRWFDLTAVRTPVSASEWRKAGQTSGESFGGTLNEHGRVRQPDPAGAPPLDAWFDGYDGTHDTWTLTTQPSSLAHYAMWPAKLAERLILMMCPREVCRVCGEPRRRVEGAAEYVTANGHRHNGNEWSSGIAEHLGAHSHKPDGNTTRTAPTLGWTDCGHDDYRPGIVLEPFAGTGTTLAVADLHGRDAIGIDIDERNRDIYPARYDEVKRALFGTPPPMAGQEAFDFAI